MMLHRFLGLWVATAVSTLLHLPLAASQPTQQNLELQKLIKIALTNPLAQAARARTDAARAQEDEVAGHRWPRFDVTSFLAPSPRIECENDDCTQTTPRNVSINVAGIFAGIDLRITQPLYTGGKLHFLGRAASSATNAREAQEDQVAGTIASHTAKVYYGYKLAQELIWMLEEGAEQVEGGLKTLEEKLAEGADDVKNQDRFRIQTLQSEIGAKLADARQAKQFAQAALNALLGEEQELENSPLKPVSFDLNSLSGDPPPDPNVRAANHAVDAQHALENAEKRGFFPDIALVGGAGFAAAQGVDDPPGAFALDPYNSRNAYVALAASWKLTPMSQRATVRRQQAMKNEALATAKAAKRLAALADTETMSRAKQAQNRMAALQDGAQAGKSWVASVLQADSIGAASAKDLADAYIAYFSTRRNVLESIYQWNLAVIELRRRNGEFAQ